MKIIIIGSIAAGVSAAARLAAAQRGAQITVYEKGGFYSCGTGGLPHYLCEDLDSLNKAIQAKETELNAQGITAHLRHEVRGIDAAARKVTVCDLATGRVFEDHYDKLVLATLLIMTPTVFFAIRRVFDWGDKAYQFFCRKFRKKEPEC